MRIGGSAICVAALFCGACSSPSDVVHRDVVQQTAFSAYGQPAGYYPGRAGAYADAPAYKAWLSKNQIGIADIQNRIVEIKDGKRRPGCIGEDKYTCVATLAQRLAIADEYFLTDFNIFPDDKRDVNGKPVNGSKIFFYGFPPRAEIEYLSDHVENQISIDLTLSSDKSVSTLSASLPKDPTVAQTQAEYDKTGLYEIVWATAGTSCATLSREDVAKWFQNTIKPHAKVGPKETWSEPERGHARDVLVWKAPFCGRVFDFHALYGQYAEGFQHVDFGGMTVTVK